MKIFTKEDIKKLIESIGQEIIYEDETTIEIENIFYGDSIIFDFNKGGYLIQIGS